jgi:hypothetical protein
MKKYMVFGGNTYYPVGGFHDFIGHVDTLKEVLSLLHGKNLDWYHVVVTETGRVIKQTNGGLKNVKE